MGFQVIYSADIVDIDILFTIVSFKKDFNVFRSSSMRSRIFGVGLGDNSSQQFDKFKTKSRKNRRKRLLSFLLVFSLVIGLSMGTLLNFASAGQQGEQGTQGEPGESNGKGEQGEQGTQGTPGVPGNGQGNGQGDGAGHGNGNGYGNGNIPSGGNPDDTDPDNLDPKDVVPDPDPDDPELNNPGSGGPGDDPGAGDDGNGNGSDNGDDSGAHGPEPPEEEPTRVVRYEPGTYGTFEADDNTHIVKVGDPTPAPPSKHFGPSDSDYEFVYWLPEPTEFVMEGEGDIVYTAIWQYIGVKVFFFIGDSNVFSEYAVVSADKGQPLGEKMPGDPEKEGYNFMGWTNGAELFDRDTIIVDSINVYALFDLKYPINYYVNFHFGDYRTDENKPRMDRVTYSTYSGVGTVTIPASSAPVEPDWEGYNFGGWYTEIECINKYDFKNTKLAVSDNPELTQILITLYAKWYKIYTVRFYNGIGDDNGGKGSLIVTRHVNEGSNASEPSVSPREGYTFRSWDISFTHVTENLDVVAQWDRNYYTVTFVDSNGRVIKVQDRIRHGQSAQAPEPPALLGYVFTGWDTDFSNVTSNLTVKALYAEKEVKYTGHKYKVVFKNWNGKNLSVQSVEHNTGATEPEIPTREGYVFVGWDKDFSNITSNLVVTALFEEEVVVTAGTTITELPLEEEIETLSTVTPEKEAVIIVEKNATTIEIPEPTLPTASVDLVPAGPEVTPQVVLQQAMEEGIPIISVGKLKIPLIAPAGMDDYAFSMSNMTTAITGSAFVVSSLSRVFSTKKKKVKSDFYYKESSSANQFRIGGIIISILMGFAGIVLFFLNSNTQGLMVMFDGFTVFNALLLIFGIVGHSFGLKKSHETNDESYYEEPYIFTMK